MMMERNLKNTMDEIFPGQFLNPKFATFGHKTNTFSKSKVSCILDYIFYKTNDDRNKAFTVWYNMVQYYEKMENNLNETNIISLSDHECIDAYVYFCFNCENELQ